MDYGRLIGQAWRLTWRHRFLWVLGLFAPSTVGSCSPGPGGGGGAQWRAGPEDLRQVSPDMESVLRLGGRWLEQNLGLVLFVAILAALLGLAVLVISFVAQGGMARATAELARGRRISPGEAWRVGLRLFWRYLALWLLLIGLFLLVAVAVAAVGAVGFALAELLGEPVRTILAVLGALLAFLLVLIAIPFFLAVGIVAAFAQRAIAVENVGPIAGLGAGLRLLREHLGTSALVWLINLALSIGAGLAIALGAILLLLPLGAMAAVLFAIVGLSPAFISYLVAAVLALIAGVWFLGAVANTFFWNYWTLTYLNFTGRLDERLEAPPGES